MEKVNHPDHYNQGNIECIDALQSTLSHDEFRGFLHGNILKYLWRYEGKNGVEDLKKAQWYLNKLIALENDNLNKHKFVDKLGYEIKIGNKYCGDDGLLWEVEGFIDDPKYPVRGVNGKKGVRFLKPEWLCPEIKIEGNKVRVGNESILCTYPSSVSPCVSPSTSIGGWSLHG